MKQWRKIVGVIAFGAIGICELLLWAFSITDAVRRTRCRSTDCETSGTKDRIFPFSLPKIAFSDPPGPVFLYPQR